MRSEPEWVRLAVAVAAHDRAISRHGGAPGLRDRAALEAALARPVNRFAYGDPPPALAELAAAYAYGVTKAHAFIDGNKRTALTVALVFLRLNGQHFRPEPDEGVAMMEGLASDAVGEAAFANWIARAMKAP